MARKTHADVIRMIVEAKAIFDAGCTEVTLRKLHKSVTGQKLFQVCELDARCPWLNLIARIINQDESDHIRWDSISCFMIQKFNRRLEADKKRLERIPLTKDERVLEPLEIQELVNYFAPKK